MDGAQLIMQERKRQVTEEGYSAEHDDQHTREELASAGAFFALPEMYGELLAFWQFDGKPNKGKHDRIRQLVIAGAFMAAEIDRLQREQYGQA